VVGARLIVPIGLIELDGQGAVAACNTSRLVVSAARAAVAKRAAAVAAIVAAAQTVVPAAAARDQ